MTRPSLTYWRLIGWVTSDVVFAWLLSQMAHTHIPAVVIRSNAFLCITFNRFFVLV